MGKNRLIRALALPFFKVIARTRVAIHWLSPGRLGRYCRLIQARHKKKTFIGQLPTTGCLMELDPTHWITHNWYVRADYEPNLIAGLRRFLRPGMVCIDIGANAGFFTLFMASRVGKGGKVYAFEPTFLTFQCLLKNINLNLFQNVVAENVAVTEKSGMVEFHVGPPDLCVYNSIAPVTHPGAKSGQFEKVSIPSVSLDEYCAAHGIDRVECVKIDVEGAELQVLRGMQRVLEANQQIVVLVEFCQTTTAACGSSLNDIVEWLYALGFQSFFITADGFVCSPNGNFPQNGEMVWMARPDAATECRLQRTR